MNNAVIVDYVRSPFARAIDPNSGKDEVGCLASVLPVDMLAELVHALLERTKIEPSDIETLLTGCVHQEADQGLNLARLVVLHPRSGLPQSVGGVSIDRFCASSLQAIADAKNSIQAGEADAIICTGVQSISHVPMGGWNPLLTPAVYEGNAKGFMNMGITAENLADKYQIKRAAQEEFALKSHQKTAQAQKEGWFKDHIVSINGLDHDDCVRADTSLELMAKLKPAFKNDGSVTAASSSPVTDGATAVLITSESYAKENNLPVLAKLGTYVGVGCAPEIMGIAPVHAIIKLLKKTGLSIDQIDFIELNEAFAVQCVAVQQELAKQGIKIDQSKLNVKGGALALGHPLGASGARLVGTAAKLLSKTKKQRAIATLCVGGGQGAALLIESND